MPEIFNPGLNEYKAPANPKELKQAVYDFMLDDSSFAAIYVASKGFNIGGVRQGGSIIVRDTPVHPEPFNRKRNVIDSTVHLSSIYVHDSGKTRIVMGVQNPLGTVILSWDDSGSIGDFELMLRGFGFEPKKPAESGQAYIHDPEDKLLGNSPLARYFEPRSLNLELIPERAYDFGRIIPAGKGYPGSGVLELAQAMNKAFAMHSLLVERANPLRDIYRFIRLKNVISAFQAVTSMFRSAGCGSSLPTIEGIELIRKAALLDESLVLEVERNFDSDDPYKFIDIAANVIAAGKMGNPFVKKFVRLSGEGVVSSISANEIPL